jgi:hypothetical protein
MHHYRKVRMKGLEPPRLAAPDPKSGAAANYATSAVIVDIKDTELFIPEQKNINCPVLLFSPGKRGLPR